MACRYAQFIRVLPNFKTKKNPIVSEYNRAFCYYFIVLSSLEILDFWYKPK